MRKQIQYNQYIDHTLLAMDATETQIKNLCQQAIDYQFYAVCVNSGYVPLVKDLLADSSVKICSVIGFPLGACLTSVKAFEAKSAIEAGAQEIDMVINVGWFKSGQTAMVINDIKAVREACGKTPLKVILETCLLSMEQIKELCLICKELNVAFVKTSTGFSTHGATVEVVKLMHDTVSPNVEVKASGGIRDKAAADKMIDVGATRIGTSAGIAIVTATEANSEGY